MPLDQVGEPFLEEVRGLQDAALGVRHQLPALELGLQAAHRGRQAAVAITTEHVPSLGRAAAVQRLLSDLSLVWREVPAVPFPVAIQARPSLVAAAVLLL